MRHVCLPSSKEINDAIDTALITGSLTIQSQLLETVAR